jgi:hypothetical protein
LDEEPWSLFRAASLLLLARGAAGNSVIRTGCFVCGAHVWQEGAPARPKCIDMLYATVKNHVPT